MNIKTLSFISMFLLIALNSNTYGMQRTQGMNPHTKEVLIKRLNELSNSLSTDRSTENLMHIRDQAEDIANQARHFELTLKKRADALVERARKMLQQQEDFDLSKMDISK